LKKRENNRTKEQGEETKKLLYACAQELSREYDYQNISVEAITRMAGVTKGTFYVHFESKDALLLEMMMDYAKRMDTQYEAFLESQPDEMASANLMLALVDNIIALMTDQLGCENMKSVYQLLLNGKVNMEAVKGYGRKLYGLFQKVLERGIRRQEFVSDLPPEALTRHFVLAIRGLTYEWCIRYPDFDLKQAASEHFRLMLRGICV